MDSDRVQCPFCLKRVKLRADGKLAKHSRTSRTSRNGATCSGSELEPHEAREFKVTGKQPGDVSQPEPEEIF